MKYIKRYVVDELKDILECMGAVLIVRPNDVVKQPLSLSLPKP